MCFSGKVIKPRKTEGGSPGRGSREGTYTRTVASRRALACKGKDQRPKGVRRIKTVGGTGRPRGKYSTPRKTRRSTVTLGTIRASSREGASSAPKVVKQEGVSPKRSL